MALSFLNGKKGHRTLLPWPPEGDQGSSEVIEVSDVPKESNLYNVLQGEPKGEGGGNC